MSAENFERINNFIANAVDKVTAGAHNAPEAGKKGIAAIPSRHRLYNAAGGIGLWIVGRQIMNVLVGETPSGKKINKEDVNPILRPFHGMLAYNRYADDPHNQWMRVLDDLTPAIMGSVGAVLGSKYFFTEKEGKYLEAVQWGTKHTNLKSMLADKTISSLAKDNFVSLQQAKTWRVLSGISGVFAASSGMALLVLPFNVLNYGIGLNNAFALANGVVPGSNLFKKIPLLKWIYNSPANTTHNPALAAKAIVNNVSNCVREMESLGGIITAEGIKQENAGRIRELSDAIIYKLFPNVTEKGVERFKQEIKTTIDRAVANAHNDHHPEKIHTYVKNALNALLTEGRGLDDTLESISKEIGKENFGTMRYGNHGFAGWVGNNPATAYGLATAGLLGVDSVGKALSKTSIKEAERNVENKAIEDIGTPNTYATAAAREHPASNSALMNFVNGPVLDAGRWLSDAVINVPPQNRFFSAVGLTGGLWVGYRGMRALAGKEFNGSPLGENSKLDPVLKWGADKLRNAGVKLDFNYFINTPDNRLKRSLFWLVPTATGLVGTYLGSRFAFRKQRKELENPEFLEDYTAKIAMAQGDKWGWLLSSAAVMASASGFSNLPIPGLNYSIGLSTRSVLSYDKKVTMPGMKWWSNNKSNYYFGTKGALEYTILYALRNPSEYPQELPALAEATLKPIFPEVTHEQIAKYVNKIQDIRHRHWEEGHGIPKEQRKAAETELRAIMRGEGFEKTLEEIGLDPAKAVFDNGMSGRIADAIGAKGQVDRLARQYREKYEERKGEREQEKPQEAPYEKQEKEPVLHVEKLKREEAPEKRSAITSRRPSPLAEPPSANHTDKLAKTPNGAEMGLSA